MTSILKLMPREYVHVENTDTCDVFTVVGPITFTLYDHHRRLRQNPNEMVVVPPGFYVEVTNPMHRVEDQPTSPPPQQQQQEEASSTGVGRVCAAAAPVYTLLKSNRKCPTGVESVAYSRWKCPFGSSELRFAADSPFALMPGEEVSILHPLPLLAANEALVLEATEAHETTFPSSPANNAPQVEGDENRSSAATAVVRHRAQQEQYLFHGPGVYTPRLDEVIVERITGAYVSRMQVCCFTALYDFTDDAGVARMAGERWAERREGFLFCHPAVRLRVRNVYVVAATEALELESTEAFFDDALQVEREAKKPYLITRADTQDGVYVPRYFEKLISRRQQIHLSSTQYCVVTNPVDAHGVAKPREAEVRTGPRSFIPQPGERVTRVLDALVLKEDEALLLTALQSFTETIEDDTTKDANSASTTPPRTVHREGGSRWLVHGPRQYIPPIYAHVVERRHVMKLDENSGVYVRNIYTGQIRSVFGQPFMLSAEEELWARPISAYVRRLLAQPRQSLRVDDMSAEEIAEAAVEEGRANMRRTAQALNAAGPTRASFIGGGKGVVVAGSAGARVMANNSYRNNAGAVENRFVMTQQQQQTEHSSDDSSSSAYTTCMDDQEEGADGGRPDHEDDRGLAFTTSEEEEDDDENNNTINEKNNAFYQKSAQKIRKIGPDANPYAGTLNILAMAEANAHPPCQSANIDAYHVISANVEHNTLMRLYDTSNGCSRVVAGPATVYLEPHEHFTPLSLSGGRPKEPHQIHSLSLFLGPDYMADIIEVETRDHARLRLHLAYNWEFDGVEAGSGVDAQLAFTIPDFVGQACKALASRVRSVIAGQTFEFFHCNSSSLIRQAIFTSASADGSTVIKNDALFFVANGLRVTTVDVQSVEPVDTKTRIALTKSVQLAVEIITKAQESDASHQAALLEQEARGALELQVMRDRAKAEAQRTALLKVMGDNTVLEQAGASRAQALAESEARLAEAKGEVDATPLRCAAHAVGMDAELDILRQRAELDLAHRAAMNALAIAKQRRLAEIEAGKYEQVMAALGKETLIAMANAGPELKAQLLGALGLQGFVVTDGSTPINMLNFAEQIASRSSAA